MNGVSAMSQQSLKTHLLYFPAEENVKPVDYILYDLIEGVTFAVMSALPLARNKSTITHMQSPVCVRRAIMEDE
jgi:hypothetical protein